MKIIGHDLTHQSVYLFSLNRSDDNAVTFKLRPLPLGFQNGLRRKGLFPPTPPLKITRDSTGKPIRDQQGQALTQPDLGDHSYLANLELYHQRVAVLAVVEALRDDEQVTFEAARPSESSDNWHTYADAIFCELADAGLTAGDLISLCNEICRISNLSDQHLTQAQANFCSPAVSDST